MKVVFIGSGNLATHLSLAMKGAGIEVVQVYSQTESHASLLANKLSCSFTTEPESIVIDADIYIFSVKDSHNILISIHYSINLYTVSTS